MSPTWIYQTIEEVLRSDQLATYFGSEEFCFILTNGGHEKNICFKLAYELEKKLGPDYRVCLESGGRFDIVVLKKDVATPVFRIEAKHAFTTQHKVAFSRGGLDVINKDKKKLGWHDAPGLFIYFVSRIIKNDAPRADSGYKRDVCDGHLDAFTREAVNQGLVKFDKKFAQKYDGRHETELHIFLWPGARAPGG